MKDIQERSLVVYHLKCTCGASYIGKTERILFHRLKEHKSGSAPSACKTHVASHPGHRIDVDQVEILDCADNDTKLRIKELMHILSRQPELNKQLGAQSKFEIKTLIIQAYPQFRAEK